MTTLQKKSLTLHTPAPNLRVWRSKLNITQAEAADLLGVSKGYIEMIETDKRQAGRSMLRLAACILHLYERDGQWPIFNHSAMPEDEG